MKNILVVIDDCEATTVASPIMECALELAGALSSKVWLIHVVPRSSPAPFNVDRKTLRTEAATELRHEHDFLQQLALCVRERDIDATALFREGETISTLLKESDRLDADMIVCGRDKHNVLYGALLDCPEEQLLSKCPRPTLFVPDPQGRG